MKNRSVLKRYGVLFLALVISVSAISFVPVFQAMAIPPEPPMVQGVKVRQSPRGGLDVYFKRSKNTDGYRVQFDTNPRFTHPSRVNSSSTKVHLTAKKGKTYYVRVLGYVYDSKRRRVLGKYTQPIKIKVKH